MYSLFCWGISVLDLWRVKYMFIVSIKCFRTWYLTSIYPYSFTVGTSEIGFQSIQCSFAHSSLLYPDHLFLLKLNWFTLSKQTSSHLQRHALLHFHDLQVFLTSYSLHTLIFADISVTFCNYSAVVSLRINYCLIYAVTQP